jgi:hypothetical protein
MFLGEGKHANDQQTHQDKSGYDIPHHGWHSGHSLLFDSLHLDHRLRIDCRICDERRP